MPKFSLADLPARYQNQVAAQLNSGKIQPTITLPKVERPRIRQHQGDGMNKWEREYRAILGMRWSYIYREVSLPLANGLRYKLDFLCVSTDEDSLIVAGFEVKGQARSTGIAKLKVAASLYPWIKFTLATKKKKRAGGGWSEEIVRP